MLIMKHRGRLIIFLLTLSSEASLAKSDDFKPKIFRSYGICIIAEVERGTLVENMATNLPTPILSISTYIAMALPSGNRTPQEEYPAFNKWLESFSVEIIEEPKHGKIYTDRYLKKPIYRFYSPKNGYFGRDEAVLLVSGTDRSGKPISLKLHYQFGIFPIKSEMESVQDRKYESFRTQACGTESEYWVISKNMASQNP
jgi:hypothetical protein